jgi:hypothetical protein
MKIYICAFSVFLVLNFTSGRAVGQGCVAVRNMAGCSFNYDSTARGHWQLNLNYRYFKSYRHFRGSHEETERVENGTQVINHDNSVLVGVSYQSNKRWAFSLTIPYLNIDRSSLYEHKGNNSGERYHTSSSGIGDVRIASYYNVLPNKVNTHLTLGAGLKLPTGNYNYQDYFHKTGVEQPDTLVQLAVDQSIQPGDGGFGVTLEFALTQQLTNRIQGYASGLYLINPRNTNGTSRSPNLSNGVPLSNEYSVPDQFLLRAGASYFFLNDIHIALGARYEGVAVHDLIGRSDGFRRPGYILSIEPSVNYNFGKHGLGFNCPIALVRNRTQSVLDKQRTEATGTYQHGDAAFANYLVSVSYSYQF